MVTEQPSLLPGRLQMVTSFPVTVRVQPSVSSLPVIVTAPVRVATPSVTAQSTSSLHVPFNHPYALTTQLNSSGVNVAETPETGNNTHTPIQCATKAGDDVSRHFSLNIKQKIMAREYIELASLLDNTQSTQSTKHTISVIQGGRIAKPKEKITKIMSIESWTEEFTIFVSGYCSAHASQFQDLLKYMHIIRLGAKRSVGFGWRTYDEQFRLRKSQDPASSWANIDPELWLLFMQSSGSSYGEQILPSIIAQNIAGEAI
jgi:hypothetical protein